MSLADAVYAAGLFPAPNATQSEKKRYAELLSKALAAEVAEGLRALGMPGVKPVRGGPGEKEFQGGLGPKRVDVTYSDERHGLLFAVTIKSINAPPFGKNLKNRFGDLCTEAITLHMRFPYSVVCCLFAFPVAAAEDLTPGRTVSTFERATKLFATISGRAEYTDPGEKFEDVAMMLFQPMTPGDDSLCPLPWVKLIDAASRQEVSEAEYFVRLLSLFNTRNPHIAIESEGEDV